MAYGAPRIRISLNKNCQYVTILTISLTEIVRICSSDQREKSERESDHYCTQQQRKPRFDTIYTLIKHLLHHQWLTKRQQISISNKWSKPNLPNFISSSKLACLIRFDSHLQLLFVLLQNLLLGKIGYKINGGDDYYDDDDDDAH